MLNPSTVSKYDPSCQQILQFKNIICLLRHPNLTGNLRGMQAVFRPGCTVTPPGQWDSVWEYPLPTPGLFSRLKILHSNDHPM